MMDFSPNWFVQCEGIIFKPYRVQGRVGLFSQIAQAQIYHLKIRPSTSGEYSKSTFNDTIHPWDKWGRMCISLTRGYGLDQSPVLFVEEICLF